MLHAWVDVAWLWFWCPSLFFPLETLGQRVANKEFFMPLLKFIRSKLLLDYLGHLYRDNLTINLNMGH